MLTLHGLRVVLEARRNLVRALPHLRSDTATLVTCFDVDCADLPMPVVPRKMTHVFITRSGDNDVIITSLDVLELVGTTQVIRRGHQSHDPWSPAGPLGQSRAWCLCRPTALSM